MSTSALVLKTLEDARGKAVSGETLALICKVSRTAIWKAVQKLRKAGNVINGTTNSGYALVENVDSLDLDTIQEHLKELPLLAGVKVVYLTSVDSTNSYAKRLLSNSHTIHEQDGSLSKEGMELHKTLVVASQQTLGRGRIGRRFYSPDRHGVYFSLLWIKDYLKDKDIQPAFITAFAAIAVVRAIRHIYEIECGIKWVNDIYLKGHKVAGILTEGIVSLECSSVEAFIIGIGINIAPDDELPCDILKVAGSLLGSSWSIDKIPLRRAGLILMVIQELCCILESIQGNIEGAARKAAIEELIKEYQGHSILQGKKVTVSPLAGVLPNKAAPSTYEGVVEGIDDSLHLIVKNEEGQTVVLNSGEVTLHESP